MYQNYPLALKLLFLYTTRYPGVQRYNEIIFADSHANF